MFNDNNIGIFSEIQRAFMLASQREKSIVLLSNMCSNRAHKRWPIYVLNPSWPKVYVGKSQV